MEATTFTSAEQLRKRHECTNADIPHAPSFAETILELTDVLLRKKVS